MPYIFIACLKFNLKTWGSFLVKVPRARHVINWFFIIELWFLLLKKSATDSLGSLLLNLSFFLLLRFLLIESENELLYYLLSVLKPIQSLFFYFQYFFHHSDMFQNNPVFFQTCQIWLNTNRQKFNSTCTVLILSCDLSDPIRSFFNCT